MTARENARDDRKHVVIAGVSGFLGRYLVAAFERDGYGVSTIGRHGATASWDDEAALTRLLDGADLLVNLAGKSVNCRYSAVNRREILRSRVSTTRALSEAILRCVTPPILWVNASTATIYRHAEDREMTESTGELGTGFSVSVAKAWEEELWRTPLPGTRRVALRMAIVLGDGSALAPLVRLARLGLGGPHRDGQWIATRRRREAGTFHEFGARGGRQRFSWIHIDEVYRIIRFLETRPDLDGAINAASPNPSDDRTVMRTIRLLVGAPFGFPLWRWMLELGSIAIRTETELVLKSRWVVPERLTDAGYRFEHPELEETLRSIIRPR